MKYLRLHPLDTPVSRIALGTVGVGSWDRTAAVFDAFSERGGTCFDTAYAYGPDGASERLLGAWIERRGVRDDVVIITKGAHTPDCFPSEVAPQLDASLERLRTDQVDVYMLHRDNPDVPVAEFVQALVQEQQRGRARVVGVSNWSLERLAEARPLAAAAGLRGPFCLSNNFSLAEMIDPPWPGCMASSDAQSRRRLGVDGVVLFAWTSQAQGFFAPAALQRTGTDPQYRRTWCSSVNLARRRRAERLARDKGTTAAAIALGYVLTQPFPTVALIGARTVERLDSALSALEVTLSPDEVCWLADGAGPAPAARETCPADWGVEC